MNGAFLKIGMIYIRGQRGASGVGNETDSNGYGHDYYDEQGKKMSNYFEISGSFVVIKLALNYPRSNPRFLLWLILPKGCKIKFPEAYAICISELKKNSLKEHFSYAFFSFL